MEKVRWTDNTGRQANRAAVRFRIEDQREAVRKVYGETERGIQTDEYTDKL